MKVFSKTPVRIGLIGGGTDLPAFTRNNTGHVINCAISLYNYVFIEYKQSKKFSIEIENVDENVKIYANDLNHPDLSNPYIIFVPTVLKFLSKNKGLDINGRFKIRLESDIARGSGLGGSSSMLVGILSAFDRLFHLNLTKHELAEIAFQIERKILGIEGGGQDFYTAAFGGMNFMHFKKNDTVLVNRVELSEKKLALFESHLLVFYTGIRREAKIIEKEKSGLLKEESKVVAMKNLAELTKVSLQHLEKNFDLKNFSNCLNESWYLKKQSSDLVSNDLIDNLISLGLENGAYCGKISGAGSGGYGFYLVDPIMRKSLSKILSDNNISSYIIKLERNGTLAYTL